MDVRGGVRSECAACRTRLLYNPEMFAKALVLLDATRVRFGERCLACSDGDSAVRSHTPCRRCQGGIVSRPDKPATAVIASTKSSKTTESCRGTSDSQCQRNAPPIYDEMVFAAEFVWHDL
ncbi:protein of unknown function (plasmid) [Cupriavidus taiwanensis]|nr:protein of unknown function [Cupriavidus taiwanensis]SPA57266.1 protein of unknown function [Cupriavidus taiwanensis]